MATFQLRNRSRRVPSVLDPEHHAETLAFLSRDVPRNLFQLCWLDNHGMATHGRSDLYSFAGIRGLSGRLEAVSLLISGRLALIHAVDADAACAVGAWYRRRGVVLEHVVSPRESVTPFWQAYAAEAAKPAVHARLDRDQHLYVLCRERWDNDVYPKFRSCFEPTDVRRARLEELEPIYLASAQMHLEETLEDPLELQPEAFRKHMRHRIQSGRSFAWFDAHRRLIFKADLSARSGFGAQISGVFTPSRFRGKGIATRALFDICEELFESGLPRITLYVNAENEVAHRVYQKVGFQYHADYQTVFVESLHE